jgi:hypothetical protein
MNVSMVGRSQPLVTQSERIGTGQPFPVSLALRHSLATAIFRVFLIIHPVGAAE